MAGAMLNNSSFSRKIQEEIYGPTYNVFILTEENINDVQVFIADDK